jgi:glycerol-3-phosphate dehydrogenase
MSEQRARAREALRHGGFDLVVIGGGILGIATTWAAARSGLRKRGERVTGVELRDRVDGDEFGVGASVVNSTGPWLDHLRRMEDPSAAPSIRLSKGSHLVMRTDQPWRAAMAIPVDDVRVSFAIPWEGHLLPGTTDEAYDGDPAEASVGVDSAALDRGKLGYTFAGLRVLPGGPGDTSHAKRETVITSGRGGMISVAGGKWTTFRRIGASVLARVGEALGRPLNGAFDGVPAALPGAAAPEGVGAVLGHTLPELPADVVRHLATHYGTVSHEVLALGLEDPTLLDRVHPDGPDIWAQVVHARRNEWATEVDDVLRRRTTVVVRGLDTPQVRERTGHLLASA